MIGMVTYSKLELGRIQLDRALFHFLDEHDYVSAITLAHAAGELLGDWYAMKVARDPTTCRIALREEIDATISVGRGVFGAQLDERKEVVPFVNRAANALKHCGGDPDLTMDFKEEARGEIDRAIRNYWLCTESYPVRVSEFDAVQHQG